MSNAHRRDQIQRDWELKKANVFERVNSEKRAAILRAISAEPGVHIFENGIAYEDFSQNETYEDFNELPKDAQEDLRRLVHVCKLFLSDGFVMIDERSNQERDAWEHRAQALYGEEFHAVYGWSALRANTMTKVLSLFDRMCKEIKKADIDTPKASALRHLLTHMPQSLFPMTIRDYPELALTFVQAKKPYRTMKLEEKFDVFLEVHALAREILLALGIECPPGRLDESAIRERIHSIPKHVGTENIPAPLRGIATYLDTAINEAQMANKALESSRLDRYLQMYEALENKSYPSIVPFLDEESRLAAHKLAEARKIGDPQRTAQLETIMRNLKSSKLMLLMYLEDEAENPTAMEAT